MNERPTGNGLDVAGLVQREVATFVEIGDCRDP